MKKMKLSVVLATRNEEENIASCLESVKSIADEIIVVDEFSTDKTRVIAEKYGAKVFKWKHKRNFHETKQMALSKASGDWILQFDADERVTEELAREIRGVLTSSDRQGDFNVKKKENEKEWKLFSKHQKNNEHNNTTDVDDNDDIVAYYLPRVNYFLGSPIRHAGVYPDGVIRLAKRGKARFPAKSVHELMEVNGVVGWLFSPLEHHDSPTFFRYLDRANRYTDLTAKELKHKRTKLSYALLFHYSFTKPLVVFVRLYIRHKGFLDGMRGFVWSVFSALHFPIAYFKYWTESKNSKKK